MTGHEFRAVRKRAGYSAREIAAVFDKSDTFVYDLERLGQRPVPGRWVAVLLEIPGTEYAPAFDAKTGAALIEILKDAVYAQGDAQKNYYLLRALNVFDVSAEELSGAFVRPQRPRRVSSS